VTTPQPTTAPKPTVVPTKAPATPAPTVEPTVEPTPVPPSTPNPTPVPTPIPDKTITVTTPQELKDALAGDKEIITISGTLGSTSDYTAYDVNRAVTINGATGNNVYGTFNIRTSGVTISNINLTIRGGGVDSLKNGINVATKSVSLLNNTFNLPESLDTIGNGVVIWPMGTATPNYNISNNTFNGFNNKVPNWSSAAIVVAENITSNRLGDPITTTTLGIDETSEVNLAKANLYNDCTYGYARQDWSIGSDHVVTYTNAEIYLSGHVYLAEGTYTENLEIDNDIKIIGTNLNSKIVGTIQVINKTGANVSLEKLTVEMPATGYGSNGIIGVTGNANVSIVDSKITTENKGQLTSVGVRMTGDGANVTLNNTDIDVYYYGVGLRNNNQKLTIDGGTIDGWAAVMTSAGSFSNAIDTNTTIDIKNCYLNSTAVSNEAYGAVVLQENYNKVKLTIDKSTLNAGTPVVAGAGADDKTSALEIRSFGNVVNVSNSTLIAKEATNEENKGTKKKAAAVVRIGGTDTTGEGAANTIKFVNTDLQSKEGEMKFVSYRPLGFQSIDNIWIDGTLLTKEEVAFIGGAPDVDTTEFKLNKENVVLSLDETEKLVMNYQGKETSAVWSSSDSKIVTVDAEGNLKAIASGTATISAIASGVTKTATVKVVGQNEIVIALYKDDTLSEYYTTDATGYENGYKVIKKGNTLGSVPTLNMGAWTVVKGESGLLNKEIDSNTVFTESASLTIKSKSIDEILLVRASNVESGAIDNPILVEKEKATSLRFDIRPWSNIEAERYQNVKINVFDENQIEVTGWTFTYTGNYSQKDYYPTYDLSIPSSAVSGKYLVKASIGKSPLNNETVDTSFYVSLGQEVSEKPKFTLTDTDKVKMVFTTEISESEPVTLNVGSKKYNATRISGTEYTAVVDEAELKQTAFLSVTVGTKLESGTTQVSGLMPMAYVKNEDTVYLAASDDEVIEKYNLLRVEDKPIEIVFGKNSGFSTETNFDVKVDTTIRYSNALSQSSYTMTVSSMAIAAGKKLDQRVSLSVKGECQVNGSIEVSNGQSLTITTGGTLKVIQDGNISIGEGSVVSMWPNTTFVNVEDSG
ncbi:MAG: Ig-like domain-containing protein, partial [Anaerorhabdus sp.]